jgi:hypothetical protein
MKTIFAVLRKEVADFRHSLATYRDNPNYGIAIAKMKRNLAEKVQAPIWTGEMQQEPSIMKAIIDQIKAGDLFIWSKWIKKKKQEWRNSPGNGAD